MAPKKNPANLTELPFVAIIILGMSLSRLRIFSDSRERDSKYIISLPLLLQIIGSNATLLKERCL